jgi:hypothetical protein
LLCAILPVSELNFLSGPKIEESSIETCCGLWTIIHTKSDSQKNLTGIRDKPIIPTSNDRKMSHNPKNFIASIEENEIKNIQEIAQKLSHKGCKVKDILSFTGVITGISSGEESSLEELKIKGIKYIEEDREIRAI